MAYFNQVPPIPMPTPFLKPKLEGARFTEHTIPLDVLKDWAVFEDLVIEVAKSIYRKDNPARVRAPKGFDQGFTLHLQGVESGSAYLVLARMNFAAGLFPDHFDRAKDVILATIAAACLGVSLPEGLPPEFPRSALHYFDSFGRSLREGEKILFDIPGQANPVEFDLKARKRLVLSTAHEYTAERELRGWVVAQNQEARTFTLKLVNEEHLTGIYPPELEANIYEALGGYKALKKAKVNGVVVFDQNDCPKKFESAHAVDLLDPHDLLARLDDLSLLKDGWLEGQGAAPDPQLIRWLADLWPIEFPSDLEDPYAYPTPSGGVQLEWTLGKWDLSANLDLVTKSAALASFNLESEEERTAEVDLQNPQGWSDFANFVRTHTSQS